jgi:gamma-glutamylcyclotransferase (GGCT)/AIG2-like uncharacterized protein YtfP
VAAPIERLADVLREINLRRRRGGRPDDAAIARERLVEERFGASHHLAVYGSLAPGEVNHHAVADIAGTWHVAAVRGVVYRLPWVDGNEYPGIVLTESGRPVEVQVLSSPALPDHWARLDAFEGGSYYRALALVRTRDDLEALANIYELHRQPEPGQALWE